MMMDGCDELAANSTYASDTTDADEIGEVELIDVHVQTAFVGINPHGSLNNKGKGKIEGSFDLSVAALMVFYLWVRACARYQHLLKLSHVVLQFILVCTSVLCYKLCVAFICLLPYGQSFNFLCFSFHFVPESSGQCHF